GRHPQGGFGVRPADRGGNPRRHRADLGRAAGAGGRVGRARARGRDPPGALPVALAARAAGLEALVLPRENLAEAGVVAGVRVLGAGNLAELADFLDGRRDLEAARVDLAGLFAERARDDVDFAEVRGQAHAKRALEVAAAG